MKNHTHAGNTEDLGDFAPVSFVSKMCFDALHLNISFSIN